MNIVGLMIARDEEVGAGLTVDTCKDWVDEIVLVNHDSTDRTVEVVHERCVKYGIPMTYMNVPLEGNTFDTLRRKALKIARDVSDPDWLFMLDADMIFDTRVDVRGLAAKGEYDQFSFRTMNMAGVHEKLPVGLNEPHVWLLRNHPGMTTAVNYLIPTGSKCPDDQTFLGWNLNYVKGYKHLYWRNLWFLSHYHNWLNGTNISVEDYLANIHKPQKPHTEQYIKEFVLNRLWTASNTKRRETLADAAGMTLDEYDDKFFHYPEIVGEWECPFKIILNDDGEIIGRDPDLLGVELRRDRSYFPEHQEMSDKYKIFMTGVRP